MSRTLTKYALTAPNATCNDGSPAAYYYSPATTAPNVWVVSAAFSAGYSVGGVALADALDAFAFGAPPPPLLVENCTGFACGADCRPV